MGAVFALRMLSNLSLYYFFACFLGGFMGLSGPPLAVLFIIVLCGFLSCLLDKTRLPVRLSPFLLLGACWFFIHSAADLAVSILPAAYALVTAVSRLYSEGLYGFRRRFMINLYITPLVIIAGLITGYSALEEYALPFLIMFLFSGVFLMRTLRHDERSLGGRRLVAINASGLAGAGLAGLVIGNRAVLGALREFWIWLVNVLKGAGGEAPEPPRAASPSADLLLPDELPVAPQPTMPPVEQQDAVFSLLTNLVGLFIIVTIAAVLLFLLFRAFLGKRTDEPVENGVTEERCSVEEGMPRRGRKEPPNSIRRHYKTFLKLCREGGIRIEPGSTSLSVLRDAEDRQRGGGNDMERIRELYIGVRYGGKKVTKEDAKEMRRCCAVVKKRQGAEKG